MSVRIECSPVAGFSAEAVLLPKPETASHVFRRNPYFEIRPRSRGCLPIAVHTHLRDASLAKLISHRGSLRGSSVEPGVNACHSRSLYYSYERTSQVVRAFFRGFSRM